MSWNIKNKDTENYNKTIREHYWRSEMKMKKKFCNFAKIQKYSQYLKDSEAEKNKNCIIIWQKKIRRQFIKYSRDMSCYEMKIGLYLWYEMGKTIVKFTSISSVAGSLLKNDKWRPISWTNYFLPSKSRIERWNKNTVLSQTHYILLKRSGSFLGIAENNSEMEQSVNSLVLQTIKFLYLCFSCNRIRWNFRRYQLKKRLKKSSKYIFVRNWNNQYFQLPILSFISKFF